MTQQPDRGSDSNAEVKPTTKSSWLKCKVAAGFAALSLSMGAAHADDASVLAKAKGKEVITQSKQVEDFRSLVVGHKNTIAIVSGTSAGVVVAASVFRSSNSRSPDNTKAESKDSEPEKTEKKKETPPTPTPTPPPVATSSSSLFKTDWPIKVSSETLIRKATGGGVIRDDWPVKASEPGIKKGLEQEQKKEEDVNLMLSRWSGEELLARWEQALAARDAAKDELAKNDPSRAATGLVSLFYAVDPLNLRKNAILPLQEKLETAEKALRESDEQLTAFIAKPEGVAVLEKKRQLLAARAAAEKARIEREEAERAAEEARRAKEKAEREEREREDAARRRVEAQKRREEEERRVTEAAEDRERQERLAKLESKSQAMVGRQKSGTTKLDALVAAKKEIREEEATAAKRNALAEKASKDQREIQLEIQKAENAKKQENAAAPATEKAGLLDLLTGITVALKAPEAGNAPPPVIEKAGFFDRPPPPPAKPKPKQPAAEVGSKLIKTTDAKTQIEGAKQGSGGGLFGGVFLGALGGGSQAVSATGARAQEQARAAEMARAKEQGKGRADKASTQAPPGMPSRRLGTAGGLRGTDAGAPRIGTARPGTVRRPKDQDPKQ